MWTAFLSYDRRQYSGSLIQDLGATTLMIMGEPATGFLGHWLCCSISSSFNFRIGHCSFNFSVWKFQNWPCHLFQGHLTFLSHLKFYSNFGSLLFCQNCQWDFLPFWKFLSPYLYILHWILGISTKMLSIPARKDALKMYVHLTAVPLVTFIFYLILFNFLVWFIVSCLVWSGRVFNEWWTVKDLEGSSHDLINYCPSIGLEKLKKTMYKNHSG